METNQYDIDRALEEHLKHKSRDHFEAVLYTHHRSAEGKRSRKVLAIFSAACLSMGFLMNEKEGHLPSIARIMGTTATALWGIRELSNIVCRKNLRTLSVTHPLRLQMILNEIRFSSERLVEHVNEVEQEFFERRSS